MFRMKNKLHAGPVEIDLVGDESLQSGGSDEVECLRDESKKGRAEIEVNDKVDGERDNLHNENMQEKQIVEHADGVGKSASPSSTESDGDAEGTDDIDGGDGDGQGSDGWSLTNPCDADMIMFPVMQHRWCYCICVNLKGNRVDILDSSSAGVTKSDKYENMPNVVQDMVVEYFKSKGLDGRVEKLKAQEPKRLQLAWRDSTDVFDYGVITMRHMETYTGQALKQWDCGLKKGDEKAVNALWTKYCAAIVKSDVNEVKDKIRHLVKHSSH
ncbi:unnamed protein product [Cuscuta campestris]|uniref:Ubiquitin-like protease family profile domain-containing protein n=1 Tax=Cuscuta campestris TaxID=132261 RepID=A0A484KLM9_9ASTE|nr:unnamed protein product [Cuscuta campestris]